MNRKILKYIFQIGVLAIILLLLFIAGVYYGVFGHLYSKEELADFQNETASLVYSEDGHIIGKYFKENRTNIKFQDLPQHVVDALVATEDARYFEHEGIDSRSLLRVLFKSILLGNKSAGGGSTITQQLAKNMYGRKRYGPLTMPVNKSKEIILASRLEEVYSKEDILTLYLNTVPFGENVRGIACASGRYFNKSIHEINIEEAAVLIGILKANTYYNPRLHPERAKQRRNVILQQMFKYDYLTEAVKDSLQGLELELDYANLESEGPANYFLVEVKQEAQKILDDINIKRDTIFDLEKDGLIIETTLNYQLQTFALDAMSAHLKKMQKRLDKQYSGGKYLRELKALADKELRKLPDNFDKNEKKVRELFSWNGFYKDSISALDSVVYNLKLLQAGILAMNPKNGAVKVWVGGIDFRTKPYDQIFAQRQTASAFKPFLYITALKNGFSPCDYLDNDSIVLSDYQDWHPANYDKSVGGNYSMAASLAKSLNIPTVNLFIKTPFLSVENTWESLGFSQELLDEPATALGTATASLYEMVLAYGAFANGGNRVEPQIISTIKLSNGELLYSNKMTAGNEKILEDKNVILLNEILQKAIKEGTGASMKSVYGVNLPLAGKTGTSQDYADAWFMAYNPNLVIGTRVGAVYPSVHFNRGANGAGSTLALPIIAKTLQNIQKNKALKQAFFTNFKPLPSGWDEEYFDCEDYVDDSEVGRFLEGIFKKKERTYEEASKKAERKTKKKKKGFFKRLFGKKDD